ncbi:YbjN domain-containing protein [Candidatus Bipolaricaulota bacterium]|nr:YbjN domain-containing protein [Candidatus Bipolaricaulota bacterium]
MWLVLLIALSGATSLVTVAADDGTYFAATEDLMQQAFTQLEIAYEQGLDSRGEPIWVFTHRGITAMILPHDRIEVGGYGSLLFYAAWSTDAPFEFSAINNWNRLARFGRAYVDDQGDPVIELDLLLSGGVTLETVKLYIDVFVDSALSLASVVQQ